MKATFGCSEALTEVHKTYFTMWNFYEAKNQLQVHGYTDADWAGNVSDKRLTNGFMFSFGSGAINWSSKKQPIVALSSMEVE